MTVKELKKALANVPDDAEVYKQMTQFHYCDVHACVYNEELNLIELN